MDIGQLVRAMTLEEKASLLSGDGFWHLKGNERLGIPSVMVSDGPHGLRKQAAGGEDHLGLGGSVEATCFPTAVGMAASFDRSLAHWLGETLGEACQAEDIGILLGPGANIKRSPLCGRNFEYFSEDPYLSGEMAAAFIRGVQSQNVGACLKHFAANNQEHRRMTVDARMDERALREIYLASFEYAVKGGKPWAVMCAYNKVNGVYASENPFLLTQVLREEWDFDGFTMTDWGATADHVKGVLAGMDLEMPSVGTHSDRALVQAVREGRVAESVLDEAVERILRVVYRYLEHRDPEALYEREVHGHTARRIARETMVLLKNEEGLLPLGGQRVAFIGQYAKTPRYQGTGSSRVNASHVTSALEAVRSVSQVTYAQGYDDTTEAVNPALIAEAVAVAEAAEVAVLFVGLPETYESEGFDRTHLRLPGAQNELIRAVCETGRPVVVVLHNGAPVEMPWVDSVQAILEAYLGGQAAGGAVVDLLFGAVSPCAKLAETFPLKLSDAPCDLFFPGDGDVTRYTEGIYVGYRYYDAKEMRVLFPFGHGLSYTTFAYTDLRLDSDAISPDGKVAVSVDVTNTGSIAAKEIVQLYVHSEHAGISRPEQELKGFDKVALEAGETKTVRFLLDSRAFAYWEERIHGWHVEGGRYAVRIGASSRDIRLTAVLDIAAGRPLPLMVTMDTTIGDILTLPGGAKAMEPLLKRLGTALGGGGGDAATSAMLEAMVRYLPLHALRSFAGDAVSDEALQAIVDALNR